ncbi:amidohydrolase [Salegentibacter chungangensis]|uniref:Amidohydrolase n=1 Tax=Salegentibacter chungangensis TaxID=1335724 RepID=A0ABW3NMU5_9FLAO
MLEGLKQLRKELHQNPELSGQEVKTAERIRKFLEKQSSARLICGIGGHGLAAVFDFPEEGPSILIRCELDALPIEEENKFGYRSVCKGVSHKCGHDGHMTIVAGLAMWLEKQDFNAGKVILLFQPSEETGKGAYAMLKDPKYAELKADYAFALHNLPGEELHSIIKTAPAFSSTVQSLAIHLKGKQSHASEPENGINPAMAVAQITTAFAELNQGDIKKPDFALLTPVCIKMGSVDYGISAGTGEMHYTLRSISEEKMENLKTDLLRLISEVCEKEKLKFTTAWFDYFPATMNDEFCNEMIATAAKENGLKLIERAYPNKFGEDFGWFSKETRAAMFGLGSGTASPALHHSDYDFPEEIIESGIAMFSKIICQILSRPK